ncbi:MAG: DUF167 domain-containing protein [Holosporales bacterium]|nr:DUF167 domain-containing protein [Holosporales bacterium]
MICRFDGKSISFSIKVTTKASADRVGKFVKGSDEVFVWNIYVTAAPEAGKANQSVIYMLSRRLKIPQSSIHIVHGHTSRKKVILIHDLSIDILSGVYSKLQSLF